MEVEFFCFWGETKSEFLISPPHPHIDFRQ